MPADWILSYYKSFRLYWHYSDKSWLAKYNSSGEPGIVKGFLKVQRQRQRHHLCGAADGAARG